LRQKRGNEQLTPKCFKRWQYCHTDQPRGDFEKKKKKKRRHKKSDKPNTNQIQHTTIWIFYKSARAHTHTQNFPQQIKCSSEIKLLLKRKNNRNERSSQYQNNMQISTTTITKRKKSLKAYNDRECNHIKNVPPHPIDNHKKKKNRTVERAVTYKLRRMHKTRAKNTFPNIMGYTLSGQC
jgi:hypothetical protein